MASWMRGCCRTPDMIYLSLPRSTSDMGLKEKGGTRKNTCAITVGLLTGIRKYLQSYYFTHCLTNSPYRTYEYKKKSAPLLSTVGNKTLKYGQTPPCIINVVFKCVLFANKSAVIAFHYLMCELFGFQKFHKEQKQEQRICWACWHDQILQGSFLLLLKPKLFSSLFPKCIECCFFSALICSECIYFSPTSSFRLLSLSL